MELLTNYTFIWLALMVVFIIIEILTVGLTTIWFAGAALVTTILSCFNVPLLVQIIVFLLISIVLLIYTRPLAMKYINSKHAKTNYEGIIGKIIRITERVNNIDETGVAKVNGTEWTVRSSKDDVTIEAGKLAKVENVVGVKLIVSEYEEDTQG